MPGRSKIPVSGKVVGVASATTSVTVGVMVLVVVGEIVPVAQAAVAAQAFVVAPPQESVQVVMVEATLPQVVGQSGLHVLVPLGTQPHAPTLHVADSTRLLGVVRLSLVLVHSAPPFAGGGLLQVLVLVPLVPQAVALQAPHALHTPSTPQAAVAAQAFVVAAPQESVQDVIVEAAVPHAVGQSGSHVTTPEGTQATHGPLRNLFIPDPTGVPALASTTKLPFPPVPGNTDSKQIVGLPMR